MTVALAKDVEDFLQDQVRSGACADATELVNDVIRSLREQQKKLFNITPELEAWLLESADKPATPLTKADFTALRERVRAKISAAGARASPMTSSRTWSASLNGMPSTLAGTSQNAISPPSKPPASCLPGIRGSARLPVFRIRDCATGVSSSFSVHFKSTSSFMKLPAMT